jgi:hypothetical protein
MVSFQQTITGCVNYVDNEILNKITDWRKWVFGAGIGIALTKSTNLFNQLKQVPIIKTMGLINENDMIDIDTIYAEILKQAQKSTITFDVPMLGAVTLNQQDVEKLYRYILEAR